MTGNVLFLMSDEHSREIAGCYGNSIVRTPHLDALAARGTLFENAYCNSPICVPSRASLATGDYVHRIGYWDSAAAYDGRVPSWHHRVREAGHDMVSIGKLHYRATWNYDDHFDEECLRVGLTAYYGLCSFLDFQIGRILAALEESGFADDTLVIYTSDHGENLGNRGLWGKCVMYEESSGVPLLVAGPGVAAGTRCATPVSLVDVYPTVVEFACGALDPRERALPGESLVTLASEPAEDRVVFSEMHDDGSMTGTYMVRRGEWKLVHYVGYPPELFHLAVDPFEERNLSGRPEAAEIQRRLYGELHRVVDPDAANRRAFVDQRARIERLGGVEAILARPDFNFTPLPSD